MHSHRKLKSSFFLRDELYPERVLSKHKHYKKSGLYAILKSQLLPSPSINTSTLDLIKNSRMLLEGISQLYLDNPLDREKESTHTTYLENTSTKKSLPVASHLSSKSDRVFNKDEKIQAKPILRETGRKPIVDQRGLQEMGSLSFTNGLLESGHRYFRVT